MLATLEAKIIAGALGLVLLAGVFAWHKHEVSAAYARGKADEAAHVEAKAIEIKGKIDALTTKITDKIRSMTDAENSRIAGVADTLKLRGPGRAVCPGNPVAATPASGRDAPAGPADAQLARVPYPEWQQLLAVPFAPTIDFGRGHDQCQAELKAYRAQRKELEAAWQQITDELKKQPKRSLIQRIFN